MKSRTVYVCQQCGNESAQWMGKCPSCGNWNSLVETLVGGSGDSRSSSGTSKGTVAKPLTLSEIKEANTKRISTGLAEFDRVLGGGLVPGSVVLIAGDPGIGKSTLMLQLANNLAGGLYDLRTRELGDRMVREKGEQKFSNSPIIQSSNSPVFYVSGEESANQIKIRADRMGIKSKNLLLLGETNVDVVIETVSKFEDGSASTPKLIIVDSIQTMYTEDLEGIAGSVGQVRECTNRLLHLAKFRNIPVFLVGHVNKEGSIAGPMVLSHVVDTVLFFEGEKFQTLRLLRAIKNRFGPTDESGVFEMMDNGLREVDNPSELFLGERTKNVSGSIVTCLMEGSRPLLVEIQALAVSTQLAIPRRVGQGIDFNRLQLLVAVLSRRVGLPLGTYDIFVNVAGGVKITEPSADLAVCLAIVSAFSDKPLDPKICAIGEVGLLGEIRTVGSMDKRIKEAKRLGFTIVINPKETASLREAVKVLLR